MSYTSREQYGGPAPSATARAADPGQAGMPARQLAQGMAEVSAQFTNLWGQAEQARTINEATSTFAKLAKQGVDMQLGFAKDPDPSTVPQRFETAVAEWKQRSLEGLTPGVAQHVERQLAHYIPTLYRQVIVDASQRNITNLRSGAAGTMGDAAQGIAGARDDPQLLTHVQSLRQTIDGNVSTGVFTKAEARGLFSKSIAQAISIRAAGGDPNAASAAQGLLERFKGEMDAGDVAHLTTGLRAPLERQQGETVATAGIRVAAPASSISAAILAQESGGRDVQPSIDGARGRMQIMPGTWTQYAKPGEKIDIPADNQAVGERIIADLSGKAGGDPARIAVGYFSGPGNIAPPGSLTPWKEDRRDGNNKSTSAYVGEVMARLQPTIAQQRDTALAYVREHLKDAPLHVRLSAESQTAANYSHLEHQDQQARAVLHTDIKDLSASYGAGNTGAAIPEARIRALAPTAEAAQRTIDELTLTRTAGDSVRASAFASPADEAALRANLAGNPADTRMAGERQHAVAVFDQALRQKYKAASEDPHGYASTAPEVRALREGGAPLPQIIAASLAVQTRLGLPPVRQRVLDVAQTEQIAATLRTTGPEKADMGATLAGIAQQFGPELWNRAYGELVQHGKIGREWQAVAAMTSPAQADGLARLQRALVFEAQHGGAEGLRKILPADKVKALPAAVEAVMAPFAQATRHHPGGASLLATMQSAVNTLSYDYIRTGAKADEATKRAYQDVIGARWDTAGDDGTGTFSNTPSMLVPKGQGGKIETALDQVRGSILPGDLALLRDPNRPNATDAELRAATHGAVQRAFWINNADASGAVLKSRTPGGMIIDLKLTNGQPIEVRFDRLPTAEQITGTAALLPRSGEDPAPTGGLTGAGQPAQRRSRFLEIMSHPGNDPWTGASNWLVDGALGILAPTGRPAPGIAQDSPMPASTVPATNRPAERLPVFRPIPSWSDRAQQRYPGPRRTPTEGDR